MFAAAVHSGKSTPQIGFCTITTFGDVKTVEPSCASSTVYLPYAALFAARS